MRIIGISDCWACGRLFHFNVDHVPSINVEGIKHPVCSRCVDLANHLRTERGEPLINIHPLAYEPGD